jgi:hypothetical protein
MRANLGRKPGDNRDEPEVDGCISHRFPRPAKILRRSDAVRRHFLDDHFVVIAGLNLDLMR